MNSDFRVSTSFPTHRKTIKLIRRLGKQAVACLVFLWAEVAKSRPDGDLAGWTEEDVEIAAQWEGEPGCLCNALAEVGYLDGIAPALLVHDWNTHNGYASKAQLRSQMAKAKAERRWAARAKRAGVEMPEQCHGIATALPLQSPGNAPTPTPTPTPSPTPKPLVGDNAQDSGKEKTAHPGKKPGRSAATSPMVDDDQIAELQANPAYTEIDVRREYGKLLAWLTTPRGKGKHPTKTRFVNWLNRCEPSRERQKTKEEIDAEELALYGPRL